MNYIHLPPGRKRRMEYSKYIKERQERRRNRVLENQIYNYSLESRYIETDYNIQSIFVTSFETVYRKKNNLLIKNLLKHSKIEINENKTNILCVICQDNINNNDIIRKITNCSHVFHVNCIDEWFSENTKCPLCNFELE